MKFPEGAAAIIEFYNTKPKDSRFAGRVVFRILYEDKEYDWTVSRFNPIFKEIVDLLGKGVRKMQVTRAGTTKEDTRYEIKAME